MYPKYYFIFYFIFIAFTSAISQPLEKSNCSLPDQNYAFYYINNTKETIDILELWEGLFLTDEKQLLAFINKRYKDIPFDYQRAWRFMIDFTWSFGIPLTDEKWYEDPFVFVNSVGFGFCDDRAFVLYKIWSFMGYNSRIWYLNNHVVPEVLINGRWELYDPTYHSFYTDSSGFILGVDELIDKPYYLTKIPTHPLAINTLKARKTGYSSKLKKVYSQKRLMNFTDNKTAYKTSTSIKINPGSFILFPVYSALPLVKRNDSRIVNTSAYANLALYLPPGNRTIVQMPLIFHGAVSKGASLAIENKIIILDKKRHTHFQLSYEPFSHIEIKDNSEGVWLYYLVNPYILKELDCNIVNNWKIKTVKIPKKNQPNVINIEKFDDGYLIFLQKLFTFLLREK